jgi:hypothetical protein
MVVVKMIEVFLPFAILVVRMLLSTEGEEEESFFKYLICELYFLNS